MSKWQKTIKAARADSTLVAIARGVCEYNRRGEYGSASVGHKAFRDRCQEIGLTVPNVAYWSFLFGACVK